MIQLQCPMPTLDFDVITLGHGSGGILTEKLLQSGVFSLLENPYLNKKHDGAIFQLEGKLAFSTDSYVISPVFFPGGNIGELAVNGTVNDLSMCGAIPKYLSLSFIIEEGLPVSEFWDILVSIKFAAERAQIQIVTGDTKVVERGKGDKIFINTAGIGVIHPQAQIDTNRIEVGDRIILSHQIATHGIAIMSVREGLDFESDIVSDTVNLNHSIANVLDQFGEKIHLLRDPTRGGVATVLNEIAKEANKGVVILEENIQIDTQVAAACEMLGLDPLYVANEGVFIAIVAQEIAEEIVSVLQTISYCSKAACIGTITAEHPKQVLLQSKIGGKRVVNMMVGEQLPRIC